MLLVLHFVKTTLFDLYFDSYTSIPELERTTEDPEQHRFTSAS
jgi:hypothetical protein